MRILKAALLLFACLCILSAADFSIVMLPDVHAGQNNNEVAWVNQTAWIVAQQSALNIVAIWGVGDLTWDPNHTNAPPNDWATQLGNVWQWNSATNGYFQLSGLKIPWITSSGNHDCQTAVCAPSSGDATTTFDAQDGYSRVNSNVWYCGYYADTTGDKSNQCIEFLVNRRRFLVITMEYEPRTVVTAWAGGIINAHPFDEVVILTHKFLTNTGTLDATNETGGQTGVQVDAWARGYPNIRAILCGHQIGGAHNAYRASTANDGHTIHENFTNYQDVSSGFSTPYFSNALLLLQFTGNQVTLSQVNTTSGAIDNTTNPPYTLTWQPSTTVLFPLSSPILGR